MKWVNDDGIGVVTALAVAFIVFALGAVWVATAEHELGEVAFNRHRVEAINAAEAGARRAMGELQNNNASSGEWFDDLGAAVTDGVRVAARDEGVIWLGSGGTPVACVPATLQADGDTMGEYVVRVERLDAADEGFEYLIESWGWGPSRFSRQTVLRKVAMEIELVPLDRFAKALFAAKSIIGTNRKEVYGDVYSGESVTISNWTRIYPNDDPNEAGTGALEIFGDLWILNGTNAEFTGALTVFGGIDDNAAGTSYGEVRISADSSSLVGSESHFKNATAANLRTAGTVSASSKITGSVTEGAAVDPVTQIGLPTFEVGDLDTTLGKTTHATTAAFETWFDDNKTNLVGVHIVPGPLEVDFKNTRFSGHFMLIVQDGDVELKGFTKGVVTGTDTPITVGIVLDDTTVPTTYPSVADREAAGQPIHSLTLRTGFASIPGVVHHLVFSEGYFGAAQQSTIYGTVYGHDDISTNRLEIHFRTPDDLVASGFDFVIPDSTRFVAQPLLWRELALDEGTALPADCAS